MNVRGKKIVVVGMGRTAMALVRLLVREGALPVVTENSDGPRLDAFKQELREMGVPFECGGHTAAVFDKADFVIPSPGVSPRNEHIRRALYEGVAILGEMEFAYRFCNAPILAVTGTNGKTTVTSMLQHMLQACGHSVVLAGNNDLPFSAAVMMDPQPEFYVLEVSSYQLETAWVFRPWLAAVLNVTPDHLERHQSIAQYANIKSKIFARQGPGDFAIVNADDDWAGDMTAPNGAALWSYSLEGPVPDGLWVEGDVIFHSESAKNLDTEAAHLSDNPLPGRHNLQNALAALTMLRAGQFDWSRVLEGLRSFQGVEHRIEYVTEVRGVPFYNDSKSTNIDSLKVALESFEAPLVLIAGGRGKGSDYSVLRDLVRRHVKALITLGEDAPLLEEAFSAVVPSCERAADMEGAVQAAAAAASPGDIVLLSPACASFDMFDSFEHRGRVFKDSVRRYAASQQGGPADAS